MRAAVLAVLIASVAGPARADEPTAIRGQIRDDATGAALPDVTILATSATGASASAITDDHGAYALPVAPGTYDVHLYYLDGTRDVPGVVVQPGRTTTLTLLLKVVAPPPRPPDHEGPGGTPYVRLIDESYLQDIPHTVSLVRRQLRRMLRPFFPRA